jgi:hypothetical protein
VTGSATTLTSTEAVRAERREGLLWLRTVLSAAQEADVWGRFCSCGS